MNSKLTFFVALSLCLFSGYAKAIEGGYCLKPGTGKGSIAFISTQSVYNKAEIEKVKDIIYSDLPLDIRLVKAEEIDLKNVIDNYQVQFALIFINRKDSPILLSAPEDHWTVLNVASIKSASVFRKESLRSFAMLCGGCGSQFSESLLNAPSINSLDRSEETLPADFIDRSIIYLKAHGVEPAVVLSYEDACQEGWAPHPTNAVQQAIWDKVHNPPTKPMKITYDKDKQKPVVK